MTKPPFIWIAALLLGALAVAGAALSAFSPERIALSEAQLQERINHELPRQFHRVMVERATVNIADGRISLRIEAHTTALVPAIAVVAFARGVPRYNADRGEVFFDAEDVRLEDFGSLGLAERLGVRLDGRFGGHVEQVLPHLGTAAANLMAIAVKAYLAARPVYRFKDDIKGLVLKTTIKDIAIVGDTLVISGSLIKLTFAVAAWLFGLALVVLVAGWLWRTREGARHAS